MARNQGPQGHPGDWSYPIDRTEPPPGRRPQPAPVTAEQAAADRAAAEAYFAAQRSQQHAPQHLPPAPYPGSHQQAAPAYPRDAHGGHQPAQTEPGFAWPPAPPEAAPAYLGSQGHHFDPGLPAPPSGYGSQALAGDLRGATYDQEPPHGYQHDGTQFARAPGVGQFPASHDPYGQDPRGGYGAGLPPAADYTTQAQPSAWPGYGQGHGAHDGRLADHGAYDLNQYGHSVGQQPVGHYPQPSEWDGQHAAYGHPAQPGQPQQAYHQGYGEPHPAAEPEYDDEHYEEPPRARGGRTLLVVASLVGAIVAGGGMAYAYKTFFGGEGKRGTPVVTADKRPAKSAPGQAGGKEFPNTNSKLLNRLDSQGGQRSEQRRDDGARTNDDSRVRVVPTVVVGRDGTVMTQPSQASPPPMMQASPLPGATVVVPGTSLGGGFPSRTPAPINAAPSAPPPMINRVQEPAQAAPPPTAGRSVAASRYRGPPLPERPAGNGEPRRLSPSVAQPAPRRVAAVERAPAAETAAPASQMALGSGGNGFVAVLSSSRSQIDALKAFADLQQKYPTVLQSRTPEVREADLSARGLGKMYRAVVGPPGSRQAAAGVCSQLKSAGYTGCWVSAY